MAMRYQEMYLKADEELSRLKKERSSIDRLLTHAGAFEAAMIVLARHGLMTEFADEITAFSKLTAQQAV